MYRKSECFRLVRSHCRRQLILKETVFSLISIWLVRFVPYMKMLFLFKIKIVANANACFNFSFFNLCCLQKNLMQCRRDRYGSFVQTSLYYFHWRQRKTASVAGNIEEIGTYLLQTHRSGVYVYQQFGAMQLDSAEARNTRLYGNIEWPKAANISKIDSCNWVRFISFNLLALFAYFIEVVIEPRKSESKLDLLKIGVVSLKDRSLTSYWCLLV